LRRAGGGAGDVCRKHGVSSATLYKWKARYGGLELSGARKTRNAKLKKLPADAMLDNAMLNVFRIKLIKPVLKLGCRSDVFATEQKGGDRAHYHDLIVFAPRRLWHCGIRPPLGGQKFCGRGYALCLAA
jgi:putative transposase